MNHIESSTQKTCVTWFRLQYPHYSNVLFAVPNGGYRNAREAARMKAEGTVAGVADIILLVARNGYNSLCVEFKTATGKQSALQKQWQKDAEDAGNKYVICRSFDEFMDVMLGYLG